MNILILGLIDIRFTFYDNYSRTKKHWVANRGPLRLGQLHMFDPPVMVIINP
jgi:hypothetical protein